MSWIISRALMAHYESSHSSPEQEAEFWAGTSSAGEPSAPSSGSRIPQAYSYSVKTTDSSPRFPSGMTYRRLTEDRGAALLTWYLEGFLARTYPRPAKEKASPVLAADYGVRWRELSARWNRDTCSWRIPPSLWDEGWTSSLGTLPRWGSMRDGALWERVTLVRLTSATESGFLPTPVKYDSHGTWESNNYHGLGWSAKNDPSRLDGKGIAKVAAHGPLWPTPTAQAAGHRQPPAELRTTARGRLESATGNYRQIDIGQAAKAVAGDRDRLLFVPTVPPTPQGTWPTPTCTQPKMPTDTLVARMSDGKHDGGTSVPLIEVLQRLTLRDHQRKLPTPTSQNGLRNSGKGGPTDGSEHHPGKWQHPGHPEYGELNPEWVEWIMGWPIGWTGLEPMSREAFDAWLRAQSARPETGFGTWWLVDPSDVIVLPEGKSAEDLTDEDLAMLPRLIPKTVKPKDKEDDERRQARIACLGNGQVSAVVCAGTNQMANWQTPDEGE